MKLTTDQLNEMLRRNPSLARINPVGVTALPATVKEHHSRKPLEAAVQREAPSSERFEIVFTVYACRPCDWDNIHCKELQDMVVAAGIIPDDAWDTLSGRVVSKKAETKADEKTVIEITRLP